MAPEAPTKAHWLKRLDYLEFERVALACVMLMITAIAIFAIVTAAIKIATDMMSGGGFLDKTALQDTLGLVLLVLILLEFNHSVFVSLREHSGAIQARILVLITVLVVLRKIMLMDFSTVEPRTLFGFAGLLLALGVVYWLILDGERRQHLLHKDEDRAR
jgi:uncharacterized membrane protein (DUF373 family)